TRFVTTSWCADAPLTATGLAMLAVLAATLVGVVVDPRTITGMPAWIKPAKFAASIALYTLTLAWVFTYLPGWTRLRRLVSCTTAATFLLEETIIVAQAWRGHAQRVQLLTAARLCPWCPL